MHPALKVLLGLLFVVGYAIGTLYYEMAVMKMAIGWWVELIKMRDVWSPPAKVWYFLWVAVTTFVALPHFLWAPVYLIRELVYLFRQYQHSKPYEARNA